MPSPSSLVSNKAPYGELFYSLLINVVNFVWHVLLRLKNILQYLQYTLTFAKQDCGRIGGGLAAGKTVLVTTGRQAKTLHTVRALKQIGATVIVADYESISASALSLSCDKFILLPSLDAQHVTEWIRSFRNIIEENNVDVVLPVSTINEVLFICLAKERLRDSFPHVSWICPDLETVIQFDDRTQFSRICEQYGVATPAHGVLRSRHDINIIPHNGMDEIILKRIESSVNRKEEIVPYTIGKTVPSFVQPSNKDPWQWQRFIEGREYSAWYICIAGKVTFSACYCSGLDLVQFDGVPLPDDVDVPIRRLISAMNLTGQFAFDYITERSSNKAYVIECNPRASSILETVSTTPLWAEAFFGVDVIHRTVSRRVGFIYHKSSWPWAARQEGFFQVFDPLPFFGAEVLWPLMAVGKYGLLHKAVNKIDVNICKAIVDGPSPGRDLDVFRSQVEENNISIAKEAVRHADTLLLDVATPKWTQIRDSCCSAGRQVLTFSFNRARDDESCSVPPGCTSVSTVNDLNQFVRDNCKGETRLVLGENLARLLNSSFTISYRVVTSSRCFEKSFEVPLRKIRVLHIVGSNTSEYYAGLSSVYGFQCVNSIGKEGRFEHIIAYVHLSGQWSIGVNATLSEVKDTLPKLSPGEAIAQLESLMIDVCLHHMFDYDGMTAYRSLLRVLNIPIIGCSGEALALSTNKARTKACVALEGVRVAKSEILRRGDEVNMPLPLIVKPMEEDNSLGITAVYDEENIADALQVAFQYSDEVLCEEFIPLGRELRVAVVEKSNGEMEMLPIIEYLFSAGNNIRRPQDKVTVDKGGVPANVASGGRVCPANVDDNLKKKLFTSSVAAHRVLGCTDYSIYDYRIASDGEAYLLESCLYCSFSPKSVLVAMQAAIGIQHPELFVRLCEKALSRKNYSLNSTKIGMK